MPRQISVHALQIGSSGAAGAPQAVDDRVVVRIDAQDGIRIGADLVGQVGAGTSRQIDPTLEGAAGIEAHVERATHAHIQLGASGHGHHGIDIHVMVGREGQLVGIPPDVVVDVDVPCRAGTALAALDFDVGTCQAGGQGVAAHVAARGGNGEVHRVEQPFAGLALRGAGIDLCRAADPEATGGGFNEPAIAPQITATGRDNTADFGDTVVVRQVGNQGGRAAGTGLAGGSVHVDGATVADPVAGFQADGAALVRQAGGFQTAGVVDDPALKAVGSLGREDDQAAGGLDRIAVNYQRRNARRLDSDVDQTVVVELQLKGLARRQCHRSHLGNDDAVVADLRGQQGDIATEVGGQRTFVLHLAGGPVAGEIQLPRHEVVVADTVGCGGERTDVYAGATPEVDPAGVGQEDLAVGVDPTKNLAGVGVQHAVEDGRTAARLDEIDCGAAAHIEAVPVYRCPVRGLGDVHGAAGLTDRRAAGDDLASGGQLGGGRRVGRRRDRRDCGKAADQCQ